MVYKVTVKAHRERFMEPDLHDRWTETIIADSPAEAIEFEKKRFEGSDWEFDDVSYTSEYVLAIWDARNGGNDHAIVF